MRLLISNLNSLTTTSHVVALLGPFGLVTSAVIMMNLKSGYSEGMALVEMEYKAGQMVISELNNSRFMNYYINVEETTHTKNSGRVM
jgi:RNA recognition motif-containing protein